MEPVARGDGGDTIRFAARPPAWTRPSAGPARSKTGTPRGSATSPLRTPPDVAVFFGRPDRRTAESPSRSTPGRRGTSSGAKVAMRAAAESHRQRTADQRLLQPRSASGPSRRRLRPRIRRGGLTLRGLAGIRSARLIRFGIMIARPGALRGAAHGLGLLRIIDLRFDASPSRATARRRVLRARRRALEHRRESQYRDVNQHVPERLPELTRKARGLRLVRLRGTGRPVRCDCAVRRVSVPLSPSREGCQQCPGAHGRSAHQQRMPLELLPPVGDRVHLPLQRLDVGVQCFALKPKVSN